MIVRLEVHYSLLPCRRPPDVSAAATKLTQPVGRAHLTNLHAINPLHGLSYLLLVGLLVNLE